MMWAVLKRIWRPVGLVFGLYFGLAGSVLAGDVAEFRAHGFSKNGMYFVFEEFGRQDGSGFPYSNFYFLDLKTDKWLKDSPIRVRLNDEQQSVIAARASAFQKASPLMQRYQITRSGVLMAASPINEAVGGMELAYSYLRPPILDKQPTPYILTLWQEDMQDFHGCNANGRVMGFGLDMTIGKNGGPGTHIYEDKEIPKSRNCPMAYRLIAVYAPSRYSEFPYSVALIGVYRRGFEGPDMRYIAVPIRY